ncbi:MAG: FliI/YscN family ATPase [Phycisphaerales bacterium]|nr:FliI/YscN family ATPase [Phycisphaerales bacterium]
MTVLAPAWYMLDRLQTRQISSCISSVRGQTVTTQPLSLPVGALVSIESRRGATRPTFGEVIAADHAGTIIMLFSSATGLGPGDRITAVQTAPTAALSVNMLGRVLDGLGRPLDGAGPLRDVELRPVSPLPMSSLHREPITSPLATGVRAIDGMLTAGKGQRLGVFAGPGVGKSTLLGSIARNTRADVSVIALIGERGREVREFIERTLGPEGLARSVVFVSTGDESPLMRIRAAMIATAAAELFRDNGADVVLIMDSITRLCQAQRQIGLAAGEPPTTKGYTPSVFSLLPSLLERAGAIENSGSITGFYAVLVEGDDMTEPISDAARGILDGHISLTRKLANRGHYPAIDILDSVSRVADSVCTSTHIQARRMIARLLAVYAEIEDLINIGAYVRGSNPECDVAIELKPRIDALLQQPSSDSAPFESTAGALTSLAVEAGHLLSQRRPQQARS